MNAPLIVRLGSSAFGAVVGLGIGLWLGTVGGYLVATVAGGALLGWLILGRRQR